MQINNALTVDVEDWYQTSGLKIPISEWSKYEQRVVINTFRILDLFDEYSVKGTFFVLGCVALENPRLVKEIVRRGHEVGSHGGWHRMVNKLSIEEFREDLMFSKNILQEITGKPVVLYRAPSWSITPDCYEVLNVLQEEGFICDSSLQPFVTPLSGIKNGPYFPFHPVVNGKRLELLEFPSTTLRFGSVSVPFSGGFYFRAIPYLITAQALKLVNRDRLGMVYLHPWELDVEQPRVKSSLLFRLAQYYGIKKTEGKLRKLLQNFDFLPLGELIRAGSYPHIELLGENYAANTISNDY